VALPAIVVTDPVVGRRINEPVTFSVESELEGDLWSATTSTGEQVLCQRMRSQPLHGQTQFTAVVSFEGSIEMVLIAPVTQAVECIVQREPVERDAFVRLDTGYFDLEICSGTADGTGSSKWGLRHFSTLKEGVDLLPSGNNAIGGFYGPFFTPENGLINPPEHTKVDIEVIEQGPILHHYRMHGTVPDGLMDELKGKSFFIDWVFTYGTPYFSRRYTVDDFRTVINGRSITNKITVGDEFEAGQGDVVFDRFEAYSGTRYRAGDPYAGELAKMVKETITRSESSGLKFEDFRRQLTGDIEAAHWDLYWRLFCTWEGALAEDEIRERLSRVRASSHVLADLPDRAWNITNSPVDVSSAAHETIFPGPADKTAEFHTRLGRAMVWWTSMPSGAFQIVQRPQSGWVNWGTNSENECPELAVGTEIKTAYGMFADTWKEIADQLENPPTVSLT
jgi:hypothetical protein